jgi:flavin-binding protein dodecin
MPEHTYKIVRIVGSSGMGIQDAVDNALARASATLRNLDWFEVKEIRGAFADQKPGWYQVTLDVGFRIEDPADMMQE